MRHYIYIFTGALLFFIITNGCPQANRTKNPSVVGVFVASTPCSAVSRPLPGIGPDTDCKLIKWRLTLFRGESEKTPGTYTLHALYGLPKQGTTGLVGGGKEVEMSGKWMIVKGKASAPHAIIYRLEDSNTDRTISFLKLNDNLLHLLDSDQRLMIGSAAWSYTFNRIDNTDAR